MPLFRTAQFHQSPEDEVIIFADPMQHDHQGFMDDIEVEEPQNHGFSFSFPAVQTGETPDIEVSDDDSSSSDSSSSSKTHNAPSLPKDIWDWSAHGLDKLMPWVQERINGMPTHNGETVGVERLINYLKRLNGEISKAISTDYEGKIDVGTLEGARKWIYQTINTLEDAHEKLVDTHYKKKKSASSEDGIKKEAFTPYGGGVMVTVPLVISAIARILINGSVSAGGDMATMYMDEVKKWGLDKREQLELVQHLADMGYPITRNRGFLPGEDIPYGNGMMSGDLAGGFYA